MLPEELHDNPTASAVEQFDSAALITATRAFGELTLEIDPAKLISVGRFLKSQRQFERLVTITAVDQYPMEPRFELIVQLHSLERNERLRLKVRLSGDNPEVDSLTAVWLAANWYERETFDLFGINFKGHPNLIRIMMPDGWQGHPLRRDFPTAGLKYTYQNE